VLSSEVWEGLKCASVCPPGGLPGQTREAGAAGCELRMGRFLVVLGAWWSWGRRSWWLGD
jgi:hypothetical protein